MNQRETCLRVGVVLNGVIVDERTLHKVNVVTVGQSTKNTLVIPTEGAPKAWPLFRCVKGQHLLSISREMQGRLSHGADVMTFDDVRSRNRPARGGWTVPVDRGSRGKITVGDATILFQLVQVPVRPRPALPASVRGTLADRINPALAAIVAISVIVHGSFAYWLYQRDVKSRTRMDVVSANVDTGEIPAEDRVYIITPDQIPDPPAPGVDVQVPGDPVSPQRDRPRVDSPHRLTTGPTGGDMSDAQIRELLDGTAAIAILTGDGTDRDSRYGQMSSKDPGSDLDQSLRHIGTSGDRIVTNRPDGLLTRDGSRRDIIRGDGPDVTGPSDVRVPGDKLEIKVPMPEIDEVEPLDPDGVSPEEIYSVIKKRYVKGVQKCHSDLLKEDPTAGGRLDVEFTVNRVGKVVRSKVNGIDDRLETCVQGLASRWRFPVAKADGEPIDASYATVFQLRAPGR